MMQFISGKPIILQYLIVHMDRSRADDGCAALFGQSKRTAQLRPRLAPIIDYQHPVIF